MARMDEVFQIIDSTAAQAFLKRFPPEAQRRGQDRFRAGAVENLAVVCAGSAYAAEVLDIAWKNQVKLEYDPAGGWDGTCSCPGERHCAHVFAAMSALLAEHRTVAVRLLSSGQVGGEALGKLTAKAAPEKPDDLRKQLMAATNRPLSREASHFITQVQQLYARCRQTRQLGYWELQSIGLPLYGYDWDGTKIWPSFPRTQHEFWLYLANFMKENDQPIPPFMLPITDLSLIAEPLARWRRAEEIRKWKHALGNLQPMAQPQAASEEIDVRLVIYGRQARLQWKPPGQPDFENLKQQQFRQLQAQRQHGDFNLVPEAELLWELFATTMVYSTKVDLEDRQPSVKSMLNRVLRIRALNSRVVNENGQALTRASEPLRWSLVDTQSAAEDYRLRLVQADGSPLPEILCILPGTPTFYLTETTLFPGPDAMEELLDPAQENRIPAPAVEQPSGVSFLQSLGVELPSRLRERVQTLPYQVTIRCKLGSESTGSNIEVCFLEVLAKAGDGHCERWTGTYWIPERAKGTTKKRDKDNVITIYDSSQIARIPALLAPLNLRLDPYDGDLSIRVTKKFAETFTEWLKSVPPEIEVKLEGELATLTAEDVVGRVKLAVTEQQIDWFDLQVVLDVDDTTLSPAEIKLMLNAKGGY
ncbi:MAG TPA: hypothetical protein VL793_09330, partial [Patescibacteria group bacterium]|nr:hypothetical protein [Patescibacteria group bacterium]